ncbi:MAG: WcbI family polysaccharide biosynthesis putative acetyltransferase [Mobilicoccus sp.]|nr:WcbI family polysaccharide biosynthesis putative acetyltransferase [Mobilicoccus sp.]
MATDWRSISRGGHGDRPLLVVHGNCQAESLRVLCDAALGDEVASVRVPPVFELEAQDVADFHALMRRTSYLVTQPIVDDYRDLPLGTAQITALLPRSACVARVPVLRWSALMPTHAIVRASGVGDPPVVPYHDLRVLASAARGEAEADLREPSADAVRAVREISAEQLRIRQDHHGTVDALSLFDRTGAQAAWTINHPQNPVLIGVAEQALARLGLTGTVQDPGRVLLSTTTAPVSAATLAALDLDGAPRAGAGATRVGSSRSRRSLQPSSPGTPSIPRSSTRESADTATPSTSSACASEHPSTDGFGGQGDTF